MFIRSVLRGKHIYNIYSRKRDYIHITVNSVNVHSISRVFYLVITLVRMLAINAQLYINITVI